MSTLPLTSSLPSSRFTLPTEVRSLVAGAVVAFVACLLAAELILGQAEGHAFRVLGLVLLHGLSIALAGAVHPEQPVSLAERRVDDDVSRVAFSAAPGSVVPFERPIVAD